MRRTPEQLQKIEAEQRVCPTCRSVGFKPSVAFPDGCEFCDGTIGGVGPGTPEFARDCPDYPATPKPCHKCKHFCATFRDGWCASRLEQTTPSETCESWKPEESLTLDERGALATEEQRQTAASVAVDAYDKEGTYANELTRLGVPTKRKN